MVASASGGGLQLRRDVIAREKLPLHGKHDGDGIEMAVMDLMVVVAVRWREVQQIPARASLLPAKTKARVIILEHLSHRLASHGHRSPTIENVGRLHRWKNRLAGWPMWIH